MTPRRGAAAIVSTALALVVAVSPVSGQPPAAEPGAQTQPDVLLPPVTVIGSTPLPALGSPVEKYPGSPIAVERFVAPGAPIAGWVGLRVRF